MYNQIPCLTLDQPQSISSPLTQLHFFSDKLQCSLVNLSTPYLQISIVFLSIFSPSISVPVLLHGYIQSSVMQGLAGLGNVDDSKDIIMTILD